MQKKFENGVRPKLEKEARKEVCVTMIEGLEEVEHERSVEQRKQEEEEGFGASTILDDQANKKELNTI